MRAILRKNNCLAAIGERPMEIIDYDKWNEIDSNTIADLHPASLGPDGSQTQPINIISSLDCGLSNPYRDVGPSPTQIASETICSYVV